MPTVERTPLLSGVGKIAEPGESSAELFGRRRPQSNSWQPQDRWMGLMILSPLSREEEPAASGPTVLGSAEVSLEKVSLANGPVIVEVSDKQAQQIQDLHGGDAFPSQ